MTPTRGWAPKWTRCLGRAPYGHGQTSTFVCALRSEGLVAPVVFDGPINGDALRAWVEQMRAPQLRPGDIVVMDNLGSHKVAGVREAIEAAGAQLRYLPAYSPDFNPIEQVFAKLKTFSNGARTRDTLWAAFGELLDQFGADECLRYIRHCGYGRSGMLAGTLERDRLFPEPVHSGHRGEFAGTLSAAAAPAGQPPTGRQSVLRGSRSESIPPPTAS